LLNIQDGPLDDGEPPFAINGFTLIDENYIAMADLLIPRAVSYSAGLLNYFFRGRLEISAPDDHVYAIVDQNTNLGFKTVKLKVRNLSQVGGQEEVINSGELVAVARFLRNSCYKKDLSGDFGATGDYAPGVYPGDLACRTYDLSRMETAVSARKIINFSNAITQGMPTEFEFDFTDDPIPEGATDMSIQVVYKGTIGQEYGIAVGHKDIFEPHYVVVINNSDYVALNGHYEAVQEILDDTPAGNALLDEAYLAVGGSDAGADRNTKLNLVRPKIDPIPITQNWTLTFGAGSTPVATLLNVPPGRFGRIAFLQDSSPFDVTLTYDLWNGVSEAQTTITTTLPNPNINIYQPATGTLFGYPVTDIRKIYRSTAFWSINEIGTPIADYDATTLVGDQAPIEPGNPIEVNITF